jgi:hypothetical protein
MVEPKEKPKSSLREPKAKKFNLKITPIRSPHDDFIKPLSEDASPSPDNLGGAKKSSLDKIAPPNLDLPITPSLDTQQPLARTVGSLPYLGSPTNLSAHPLIEQAERINYRKGHTRHNHDFWDTIISQLPGNEQNVFSWLYRFREGNSNITIILSLPTLAARCGINEAEDFAKEIDSYMKQHGIKKG